MNKTILMGRLTDDPEVKYTNSGKAVCSFTLAVQRFTGNNDATDFIPVVAWEKLAEIIGNNLAKGRRALIEGRIQIRSYEASDGQKRRVTEVVAQQMHFVDSKGESAGKKADYGDMGAPVEEEIPF